MGGYHYLSVLVASVITMCSLSTNAMVETEPNVIGFKDGLIRLRCDFSGTPYAVFWEKVNASDPADSDAKARYLEGKKTNQGRFTIDDQYALIVHDLVVADEGSYFCNVELNGEDYKEFTELTVNALASQPVIRQCEDAAQPNSNLCTFQPTHEAPNFNLVCTISGFKPNVSLKWQTNGRDQVPLKSSQTKLQDGTSEREVTIGVSAKNGTDQNFTCTATGEAVNGTASALIVYKALPAALLAASTGLATGGIAGIVIVCIVSPFLIVALLLFLAVMLRRHNKLPDLGRAVLNKLPYLKEPIKPEEQDPETLRLIQLEDERKELRERIENYVPGIAANIPVVFDLNPVNINLFGQMGAGKSAFMNSINYAVKGEYKVVTEEGSEETGGGKTETRIPHPLTEYIRLVDNRGMKSYSEKFLDDILPQIRGERGADPNQPIEMDTKKACHCPVFAYHWSVHGQEEALKFINSFHSQVYHYFGRSPMVVLTHKDSTGNVEDLRNLLHKYNIPKENVWAFENYTNDSHVEDQEKDIELMKFLWAALESCDRNIYYIKDKSGERHIARPVTREPEANNQNERANERPGFWSRLGSWLNSSVW